MIQVKAMKLEILLEKSIDKDKAAQIRTFISNIKGVYAVAYSSNSEQEKACECNKGK